MSLIHVSVTKPGKLGLQFTRMIPPYIVKTVPDSLAAEVCIGDLLTDIQIGEDPFEPFTSVLETDWQQFVSLISSRPITLRFEREAQPEAPTLLLATPNELPTAVTPVALQETPVVPLVIPIASEPVTAPSLPLLTTPTHAPTSVRLPGNAFEVVFAETGPLGLQFDVTQYPFEVSKVEGVASSLGIRPGDCLDRIGNLNFTKSLSWLDVQRLLSARPVTAIFIRYVKSPREKFPGFESLLEEQRNLLSFERMQNERLQAALEAAADEHARVVHSLEQTLLTKNSQLIGTRAENDRLAALHAADEDVAIRLDAMQNQLTMLLEEKKVLTAKNDELSNVANACMQKLQKALDERPLFIERRMVIKALSEFIKTSKITSQPAINRLCQLLGFTEEERATLSPERREDLAQAFVAYLEHS